MSPAARAQRQRVPPAAALQAQGVRGATGDAAARATALTGGSAHATGDIGEIGEIGDTGGVLSAGHETNPGGGIGRGEDGKPPETPPEQPAARVIKIERANDEASHQAHGLRGSTD